MCGVAALLLDEASPDIGATIAAMCDVQAHRGPDGDGFAIGRAERADVLFLEASAVSGHGRPSNVALGHRRLAIIDREGGVQPMSDPSGRVWIAYNGEVYNFAEVRERLEVRGHRFRTRSDTEVVLAAYLEWGAACVESFVGMFALVVWDGRARTLFLARDPLGIKPLHYAHVAGRFVVASEIKGVRAALGARRDLDLDALDHYLCHDWIPAPFTIHSSIRKLRAGERLTVRWTPTGLEMGSSERYWRADLRRHERHEPAEWAALVRERVDTAVREALVSDVPIGAFLSGGVDSSVIVSAMARAHPTPPRTVSVGFQEAEFSELPHARRVADRFHTEHSEFVVSAELADILPRLVHHYDEPFADPSAVPTYYVCREARRAVTVALSGDGGDELFAGYSRYPRALGLSRWIDAIPARARRLGVAVADNVGLRSRFPRWKQLIAASPAVRYAILSGRFDPAQRREMLRPDVAARSSFASEKLNEALWEGFPSDADQLTRLQATDVALYLADDINVKVDRASMMHSLEVRPPFLDHRLVELALAIPSELQIRDGVSKWPLKEAYRDQLGSETLDRPKMGFGIPVDEWLRGPLREMVLDVLVGTPDDYLEPSVVRRYVDTHLSGARDWGYYLWNLLVLKLWLRHG